MHARLIESRKELCSVVVARSRDDRNERSARCRGKGRAGESQRELERG
jgi:hypothetical protein